MGKQKKCLNCEALLTYDDDKDIYICEYCRSKFTLEQIETLEEQLNDFDYLIPFKVSKKEAIKILKKLFNSKPFRPNCFNLKSINKLKGIYIPIWLFDNNAVGVAEFDCDKISKWKSDGYKYVKTDKYKVSRSGKTNLQNVLVNDYKKSFCSLIEKICPYNYDDFSKTDLSCISNYSIGKSNLTKDEAINKGIEKTKQLFIEEIKCDIKGYKKIKEIDSTINLNNTKCIHALVPIWILNIKNKKNNFVIAINGQTGKIVESIPKDKSKIITTWIFIFILIFILLFGLSVLKVML